MSRCLVEAQRLARNRQASLLAILFFAVLTGACSEGVGNDAELDGIRSELDQMSHENEVLRRENTALRDELRELEGASAPPSATASPPSAPSAEPSFDEPPEGYEYLSTQRIQFRVYGPDSVTFPALGIFQNRCGTFATGIKFRSMTGGTVRVFEAGCSDISAIADASGGFDFEFPMTAPTAVLGPEPGADCLC